MLFGVPTDGSVTWEFWTAGSTGQARIWTKPPGCTWVYLLCVGGGGGGGAGFSGAAGTARGGGGGGSSGSGCHGLFPAALLPNQLWVRVGQGGASASAGTQSIIHVQPPAFSGATIIAGTGGAAGGTGTGAAGGSAGSGPAAASSRYQGFGIIVTFAGVNGAAGGAQTGAVGGAVTPGAVSTIPLTGGAGGGGTPTTNTDFAGGPVNAAGPWPLIAGGTAGGGAGNSGFGQGTRLDLFEGRRVPFMFSGGSGGGTNGAAGTGGAGGKGGLGCGGGGGGAGVTGGAGGRGGDGFIIIGTW